MISDFAYQNLYIKMAKKQRSKAASKAKIQKRALNAFEIAEKETKRSASGKNGRYDDSESDDPYADPDASDNEDMNEGEEDEDEEIDSDEAFGSSDEEEILDSKSWRTKRKNWKKRKGDDDEDDEEEDDDEEGYSSIDESELLPLSAVWDLDDKDLEETEKANEQEGTTGKVNEIKLNEQAGVSSSESGSDEEESDEDSEESGDEELDSDDDLSMSDQDFDEVDEEKLSSLRAMISDLSNTDMVTEEAAANLKRQKLVQINNVAEGEFSVPTGGDGKLSLADLTNSISDSRAVASLALLQDTSSKEKAAPLSVPLPKRLQDRLDRGAAYDISKKEVGKWKDVVASNRNAEYLQFPINPAPEFTKPSSFAPLAPETSLEKRVNAILEQSALADEKNESTFEQLAPSTLSIAELRKRRNELRMMRELMFREEQKAKRIKKIKSKTYRKIHKKQRERERELVEGEEEDSDEAAADHDAARAEERMSLRHKNTGKWAKSMVQQGFTKDKATRAEMEEMLRRGEQLRTKIMGRETEEQENNDEDFLNEQDASDDEETNRIKEKAGKGVLAMKFMRDAEAAERKQNMLQKQELMAARDGRSILSDEDESKGANEVINEGRRKYAPGSKTAREEMEDVMDDVQDELDDDESRSLENRLSQKRKRNPLTDREPETKSIRVDNTTASKSSNGVNLDDFAEFDSEEDNEPSDDESNPWLAVDTKNAGRKKKSVTVVGRDSSNAEKSQDRVRKQKEQIRSNGKKVSATDGIIDMNQTLKVVDPFGSDVESDDNLDEEALSTLIEAKAKKSNKNSGSNRVVFKQTDLVKRAFAADDVVAEFEEEKRLIAEEDGDKEVDVTLPGWGSWGGSDIAPKKKFIKKVKGVVNEKNRKDYNLNGVILNEKINKKAAVYKASSVPFPFENREQYERSLRMPIGEEWSTTATHQKLIKPRISIKEGLVIDPIQAPFQHGEDSD